MAYSRNGSFARLPGGSREFELVCALGLLFGLLVTVIAFISMLLLVTFSVAAGTNLARGRRIECGCRGFVASTVIGWRSVLGNVVLAAMAGAAGVVNPTVLAIYDFGRLSHASALGIDEGLAILVFAGTIGVTQLIASAWVEVRSEASRFATESFLVDSEKGLAA